MYEQKNNLSQLSHNHFTSCQIAFSFSILVDLTRVRLLLLLKGDSLGLVGCGCDSVSLEHRYILRAAGTVESYGLQVL